MTPADFAAALGRIEKKLEQLATTPAPVAVKRAVAAKMMGISRAKLEALVRDGKVKTAVDPHLIPMSEIRHYCAPKVPRRPAKRYDRVPDSRDEARLVREALRK